MKDYTEIWQMKDSITTVVEANGYAVWDIQQTFDGFKLELTTHLDDEASSNLCGQFPLSADYIGEAITGTEGISPKAHCICEKLQARFYNIH